jgi:cobalt-precorrin-5B (C1)-methyltransferase
MNSKHLWENVQDQPTDRRMPTEDPPLRTGWTTGACATAAVKAACHALATGAFPDPVTIRLPRGQEPAFALALHSLENGTATVGIVKDAGDDPDVTHGALISATVRPLPSGAGICFKAGKGVGTVTLPGLALAIGEPAINPIPRKMMREAVAEIVAAVGGPADVEIEITVEDGERLAERTLNARLGILGGLSILGTTGIVIPYSCAAWIHGIHRGVDVARAAGLTHIAGATGKTSEQAVLAYHDLPVIALMDMGDFVGGMLKYIGAHPVPRVTVAGGVAKMAKLGQGMLDVHSKRGSVDLEVLARHAVLAGGSEILANTIRTANTAAQAFAEAQREGIALGDVVARAAWETAATVLDDPAITLDTLLFDREGQLVGRAPPAPAHNPSRPRNRR